MSTTILTAYFLSLIVRFVPPGRLPDIESEAAGRARYAQIAHDVAEVVTDPDEAPIFPGELGRLRTGVLLLSIAYYESGLRKDVDEGRTRGDGGRSCTLWQLNVGARACPKLAADRKLAARMALRAARQSAAACGSRGPEALLNAYASGSCSAGEREGKLRLATARRWVRQLPPPERDPYE